MIIICKTRYPSRRMRRTKFSGILRYLISAKLPDLVIVKRNREHCCADRPLGENKRKGKKGSIPRPS